MLLFQMNNSQINLSDVADTISQSHNIIFAGGQFYEYVEGCYRQLREIKIHKWVREVLGNEFSSYRAKEVVTILRTDSYREENVLNAHGGLNVRNCTVNLNGPEEERIYATPHDHREFYTVQLPVEYDRNATCDKWLQTLNEIFEGDQEKIGLLQEFFGYCFTTNTKFQKSLFCLGDGANGKSTVLTVLMEILGGENYVSIPLDMFRKPFYQSQFADKMANITIETNVKSVVYDNIFKLLVTGDSLTADVKYKTPITFRPFCKLIFSLNKMPKVSDKSNAYFRRLLILKFERTFAKEERNEGLSQELLKEKNGIFLWALEGLVRLQERGRFEESLDMEREIEEHKKDNLPILIFVEERCTLNQTAKVTKKALYDSYSKWCSVSGYKAFGIRGFGKELSNLFPSIVSKHEKSARYWEGIEVSAR